jgi:hypothetical protein
MAGDPSGRIRVNGISLTDERAAPYIDSDGVFNWKGITIKPSGSVRVGGTKIHPSGLIQVGEIHVEGSIVPQHANTKEARTGSKTPGTTKSQSVSHVSVFVH